MANRRKQQQIQTQVQIKNHLQLEPRVALYGRVSSDKQSKEQTIERQQSLTREIFHNYFKHAPTSKIGEFWDEGYNFEMRDDSRNFWLMMQQIIKHEINTVIVASEDRIFRGESAKLRGEITDLFRHHGVRLITSNSDTLYSRSETTDRLVTSIKQEMGAINKLEAVKTLQHGRRRKLKEEAKWYLTICPYGYRCDRLIKNNEKIYTYRSVEDEAKIIQDIYALYVGEKPRYLFRGRSPIELSPAECFSPTEPMGSSKIAEILNQHEIKRTTWITEASHGTGTEGWDKQKVLRILLNQTYNGKLTVVFPESEKVAGFQNIRTEQTIAVPMIVDDRLWHKAQAMYQARREKLLDDFKPRTDENWLHGFLACPQCGTLMRGRVAGAHRYYGCPQTTKAAPHPLLRAEDYEQQMETFFHTHFLHEINFQKLSKAMLKQSEQTSSLKELVIEETKLKDTIENLRKKRLKNHQAWEDGLIDDDIYRQRMQEIKLELTQYEQKLLTVQTDLAEVATPQEKVLSLQNIRSLLQDALKHPATKAAILRLMTKELVGKINLKKMPKPVLSAQDKKTKVLALLRKGAVTAKEVREVFGYQPKKFLQEFGLAPRKRPIEYEVAVEFKWARGLKPMEINV